MRSTSQTISYFSFNIHKDINTSSTTTTPITNNTKSSDKNKWSFRNPLKELISIFTRNNAQQSSQLSTIWDSTKGQSSKAGIIVQFINPRIMQLRTMTSTHGNCNVNVQTMTRSNYYVLSIRLWYNQMESSHSLTFKLWRNLSHDDREYFFVVVMVDNQKLGEFLIYYNYNNSEHVYVLLQQDSICIGINHDTSPGCVSITPGKFLFNSDVCAISFENSLKYLTWIQYITTPSAHSSLLSSKQS